MGISPRPRMDRMAMPVWWVAFDYRVIIPFNKHNNRTGCRYCVLCGKGQKEGSIVFRELSLLQDGNYELDLR